MSCVTRVINSSQRNCLVFEFHLACLDLGQIEHIIDYRHQMIGGHRNTLELVVLIARQVGFFLQQIGHADDGVHGRTNFVGDVREKSTLGTCRVFEFLFEFVRRALTSRTSSTVRCARQSDMFIKVSIKHLGRAFHMVTGCLLGLLTRVWPLVHRQHDFGQPFVVIENVMGQPMGQE